MQIRYGFKLSFDVPQPTAVLVRLDVHPDRRPDIISEAPLLFSGEAAPAPVIDVHGNLCRRLIAPPGRSMLEISGVIGDPGTREAQMSDEPLWPVADLPDDALVYLLASRYCEPTVLAEWRGSFSGICRTMRVECAPLSITCTATSPSATTLRGQLAPRRKR